MKKLYQVSFIAAATLFTTHFSYAQSCTGSASKSTPNTRYASVEGSNGAEILDKHTGLIWQRCSLGQSWNGSTCIGASAKHTWTSALKAAKDLGTGYRLPNIKELQTLVEETCNSPAINQTIFPSTDIYRSYLSASSPTMLRDSTLENSRVWTVNFETGAAGLSSDYKSDRAFNIRAVRTSK